MNRRHLGLGLTLTLAMAPLAACGSSDTPASGGTGTAGGGEKISVVASFYPLEYAVQQIGGDHVQVTNLTKPGQEPHDLEITPQDVATISKSKLAVYEKGLQPAVDTAITQQGPANALDVATVADLSLTFDKAIGADEHDHDHDHGKEDHDHGKDDHAKPSGSASPTASPTEAEHADHDHEAEPGSTDPHFWLDPVRYGKVADAVAAKLAEIDPANKADYEKNATTFGEQLKALDGEFAAGLKTCTNKNIVTSHAAFGYLADRYGLKQTAISGISPEAEPEPARLATISAFAKKNNVKTIYAETLVSPAIAQTVAKETGATTAVLDPIEGITDSSAGKTYLEVMRANLATLQKGQGCK